MPLCFNPYLDRCRVHDAPDAPIARRESLTAMFAALNRGAETMWIGRDLGYRGGRRTGLPFTDDVHITSASAHYAIGALRRATITPPVAERTASEIWRVLRDTQARPLLWNVFPLHPHEAGSEFTNRSHTRAERDFGLILLEELIRLFEPRQIIGIGRDAVNAISHLGRKAIYVRHPSYGGQADFRSSMARLFGSRALPAANGVNCSSPP